MKEDISKKTVAILLLVAILVSFLSTWAILSTMDSISFSQQSVPTEQDNSATARVRLTILNPDEATANAEETITE